MSLKIDIEKTIFLWEEKNDRKPKYLILDAQTYFTLKEVEFGSTEAAVEFELEDFLGLRVCFNDYGREYIDVAG